MKTIHDTETPEQRKHRLNQEAEALFLDINASFGKKAKVKKPKTKVAPLKTFFQETSAIERAMETPTWIPSAIVHYIIKQKCKCCGKIPECAGGTLVRHTRKGQTTTWDFPRPDAQDFSHLPQIVIEELTIIEACPECMRQGYFNKALWVVDDEATTTLPELNPIELYLKDHDDSGEEYFFAEDEE